MPVTVKDAYEIGLMREAGHKLEIVHNAMRDFIRPGVSTWEIDELGERIIRELGGIPNFKNYNGYPAAICISVNDEVVHGIPSKKRILKEGISSLSMRDSSGRGIIPMQPEHGASEKSVTTQSVSSM